MKVSIKGATILTISGNYFSYIDPHLSIFDAHDIAWALSNICRFGGHCRKFYSVAQHSVLVSHVVPYLDAKAGLMHDAPEAFIGDMPKPLKQMLGDYKAVEKRVEKAVLNRFGIHEVLPPSVKHADLRLLKTEQRDLMNNNDEWTILEGFEPLTYRINPLPPEAAYILFMDRYKELFDVST